MRCRSSCCWLCRSATRPRHSHSLPGGEARRGPGGRRAGRPDVGVPPGGGATGSWPEPPGVSDRGGLLHGWAITPEAPLVGRGRGLLLESPPLIRRGFGFSEVPPTSMGASVTEASWSCVRRKRRASEALARRGASEVRGCPDPAQPASGKAGRMQRVPVPASHGSDPTDLSATGGCRFGPAAGEAVGARTSRPAATNQGIEQRC